MKDFAKSIVCNSKAEVENYDYDDWKDNERHKWTVRDIEHKIDTIRSRLEMNKRRITELRQMVNSGNYGSSTKEDLRKEEADYEANQMKIKQLLSMKSRATGNSKVGNAKFKIMRDLGIMGVFKIYDGWEADSEEEAVKEFIKLNPSYANGKKGYIKAEKTGNSKVGNSFESAKSEYEKAVREIESELKSAKPNIDKYFQIKERISRTLSSERNNIQKELSAKISELIDMDSNISRLEDKFYK